MVTNEQLMILSGMVIPRLRKKMKTPRGTEFCRVAEMLAKHGGHIEFDPERERRENGSGCQTLARNMAFYNAMDRYKDFIAHPNYRDRHTSERIHSHWIEQAMSSLVQRMPKLSNGQLQVFLASDGINTRFNSFLSLDGNYHTKSGLAIKEVVDPSLVLV
jgi:hypothetical protein